MNKTDSKPEISVIVTAHNNANDLPRCLDALIDQTYKNIEIICIDDASSDDTAKIIREYEENDARISSIISEEHLGVSKARNKGLEKAAAPYIMFCDADDYYDTTMCEKMLEKMQNTTPKVGMVISEIRVVYHAHEEMRLSDEHYYNLHFSGYQVVNDSILAETDFAPTNKLFRKDLIEKYKLRFPENLHYEDAYFCAAYMCVCKSVYYLNEQLYTYIRRAGSIMSNTWSKNSNEDTSIDHTYIAFKLFEFLKENDLLKTYNTAFWQLMLADGYFSLNNSHSAQNTKKISEEINKFVQENQEYFQQAPIELQEQIKRMATQKFAPAKNRAKQVLLKLMPTYRLQSQNIVRMKSLRQKNQQLISSLKNSSDNSAPEEM